MVPQAIMGCYQLGHPCHIYLMDQKRTISVDMKAVIGGAKGTTDTTTSLLIQQEHSPPPRPLLLLFG